MKNENLNINHEYQNYIKTGIEEAKSKNFSKSIENFNQAIKIDEKNSDAYINLANILIIKNNFLEALETLKQNINKYKYNIETLSYYWNISINFNATDRFIKYFDELEKKDNVNYKNREFIYFLKGRYYTLKDNQIRQFIILKNQLILMLSLKRHM